MLFLYNEFLIYIFKCNWNRETGYSSKKISNFVQFKNKKHLLQFKVNCNDKTIKI